jgi:hypothetical protein
MELDRDGFADGIPVRISADLREFSFNLENRTHDDHLTHLTVNAPSAGRITVKAGNKTITGIKSGDVRIFVIPVSSGTNPVRLTLN